MKKAAGIVLGALGLLTFASLSVPSAAQVTQKGGGYEMRVLWKKGASYKFNASISMTPPAGAGQRGAAGGMTQQMPITMQVESVDAKGVASVKITSQAPGAAAGRAQGSTLKMDSRGRVVGSSQNLSLLIGLPTTPVKVGQSWNDTFEASGAMGVKMNVKARYTLKSVKNGVAEISASNTGAGGGSTTSGSGTYLIDVKDGMLRSATVKQTVTIVTGTGQKTQKATIPTTVTIKRV